MKIIPFNIPKTRSEAVRVQIDDAPHLYDNLHRHREIQITAVIEGTGTLIAGDYVGRFGSGDVFVLGGNLPHVFRNDEEHYRQGSGLRALAYSLFFDRDYLGEAFWRVEEARELTAFLEASAGGFRAAGTTCLRVSHLLRMITCAYGTTKLLLFFQILQVLSASEELMRLAPAPVAAYSDAEGSRLNTVLRFTLQNSRRTVNVSEAAKVANLTPEAFCRYFKRHTRKTYIQYLNEIRVSDACNLLLRNDLPVSAICEEVGFNNLSHFNKIFKRVMRRTPKEYARFGREDRQATNENPLSESRLDKESFSV